MAKEIKMYIVYMQGWNAWRIIISGHVAYTNSYACNECDWLIPGTWDA